ncbi:septum formation initiator family protein [Nocardioides sp.]|uniref:FtsB family cell division protein n=1 Tax=Nocardioides sp. TaxID=35761 RepID=UPI002C42394D|nr:septum formation initiator family protein [Nocardioides sp.]HSX66500.1 septum formation initiator family protein [Nocardioides sp.]
MAAQRRTPSRGVPRGQAGPGRGLAAGRTTLRNAAAAAAAGRERPRITSRAVVLLLVLAVLAVSWASSFRAWFQQRAEMDALRTQIAQTEADIDRLEAQKKRWKDEAFIKQQARLRFGYVMPGQDSLIALDENGNPIGSVEKLTDPADAPGTDPVAWYSTVWESVEAAGNPEESK